LNHDGVGTSRPTAKTELVAIPRLQRTADRLLCSSRKCFGRAALRAGYMNLELEPRQIEPGYRPQYPLECHCSSQAAARPMIPVMNIVAWGQTGGTARRAVDTYLYRLMEPAERVA
jgi:hypothetical protein